LHLCCFCNQWRSKGGSSGSTRPEAQVMGAQQHTFAVILNVFLSRNLDQSMLKNAYFLVKKIVKIVSASFAVCLRRLGPPPPDPCVVTPPYYYNFVEFISCVKYILFRSKKNQVSTANILRLLLPYFCTYFLIQTL